MSCRTCANEYNCSDTPVIYLFMLVLCLRNPYALYFVLISQQMLLVIQDAQAPMNELGQEMLSKTFRQMGAKLWISLGLYYNSRVLQKLYSTTMLILLLGYLIEPSSYVMCKDICSVIRLREVKLEAIQELLVISRLYTIIYCLVKHMLCNTLIQPHI